MGVFRAGVGDDIAEDQLPFASGVARIDEAVDVLAFDEFDEGFEAVLALLNRGE